MTAETSDEENTSAHNDQMHETNMQIIRNMGNQCRIGIDPGCHW